MKIAILGSRGIPANYGGFETYAEKISINLAKAGHDVTVYCPSYQSYKDNSYHGVRLSYIFNADCYFKNRILRAIGNLVYDFFSLLHVSFTDNEIVYMLGYASGPSIVIPRIFKKIMIVNPDGLEWKSKRWGFGARSWLFFCEMVAARFSNGLIADAQAIKEHFQQKYNVEAACIPYGAEITPCESMPTLPYEPQQYYLAVARMVPETSIPMIIDGYRESKSSKKLIIIGPVPDLHFFETEVMPRIDNRDVFYLGAVYDRPLLHAYRVNAAALLHGHASDGTNPSLLESMACSSPVISINRKSNVDVLGENNALYFDNTHTLSSCIDKFEDYDEEHKQRLGSINRDNIEINYSWSKATQLHIEYFTKKLNTE